MFLLSPFFTQHISLFLPKLISLCPWILTEGEGRGREMRRRVEPQGLKEEGKASGRVLSREKQQSSRCWKEPHETVLPSSSQISASLGKQGNWGPNSSLHGVGEPYNRGSKGTQPKRSFSCPNANNIL